MKLALLLSHPAPLTALFNDMLSLATNLFADETISSAEARLLVEQGAPLIDVRSPLEFRSRHLPGAVNVPAQELAARVQDIPRYRPVIVYGSSEPQSAAARRSLLALGYTQIHDLGSMSRW